MILDSDGPAALPEAELLLDLKKKKKRKTVHFGAPEPQSVLARFARLTHLTNSMILDSKRPSRTSGGGAAASPKRLRLKKKKKT